MENTNEQPINHQKAQKLTALDTRYFLPEERTLSDFLKFINRLSKQVNFYDERLEKNGDWYDFFISNELFLLAEIENFNLKSAEKEKTSILLQFERANSVEEKQTLILQLVDQLKMMISTIDQWYDLSSEYNKKRESTTLENELVAAITYRCKGVYSQLVFLSSELKVLSSPLTFEMDDLKLKQLWQPSPSISNSPVIGWGAEILDLNYLLKQLLLLHRPVLKTITNLTERSKQLFKENLTIKEDHEPHIGLMIAFFHLFNELQEELNQVPDRLLIFYFEKILGQSRKNQEADDVYCYAQIDEEKDRVILPKSARLIAGQNIDGLDILYELKENVILSNIRIASLYSLFVSRNKLIDPGTPFQTVNGIYSKHISTPEKFKPFSTLGEEQRFLSESAKTMEEVEIGFSISSPTLRLQGGVREVELEFHFLTESYQYFLAMLLSISKTKNQLPEEVFHQIFEGSLTLLHTTVEGWANVPAHEVTPPMNWNENNFKLTFILGPEHPALAPYQEEVHGEGLNLEQPLLKILLKNQHVFHPYSFLQFLELEQVKIRVDVKQLKNIRLQNNFGDVDSNIPFDLFGASPKVGSYLLIGNEEIFSKDLEQLKLGWTYHNLPLGEDLKTYYVGYPYGIDNSSFKIKIQALSDFRFMPKEESKWIVADLFEQNGEQVSIDRLVQNIDIEALQIIPEYNLVESDTDEPVANQKTGFLKFELISPKIGFGFDVYTSVYTKAITQATNEQLEKPKTAFNFEVPNEPFSPMVKDFYLEYSAVSEINFLGTRSFTNQTKKQENFIQIHPFGNKFLLKDGLVYESGLLPYFELQGALFFGIEAKEFPEEFSMLFQIEKNNGGFHGEAPKLDWFYLANDEWKAIKQEAILFDSSFGLTKSGIISFKSPKDINLNNLVMPSAFFWICCRTKDQLPMASILSGVYPNAFSATAILEEGVIHEPVLPAFSVQSFEQDIPGLLEIIQPLASSGGRAKEGKSNYFQRVSESLKHKFRAVTQWDIEKMLLQEFDWLGFVKVFGNFGNERFVDSGNLVVVGMPKIEDKSSFYLPKLNPGQLKEMELYLKQITNPFIKFKVITPQFEYLMIKGKIKFTSPETGLLFKRLYDELLEETCPWFFEDITSAFYQRETKRAEILNLITSRSYVKFFTSFSLAQMYENEQGDYQFIDGALLEDGMETVTIGKPWSILVPYPLKKIEIVEEENYLPAEAFDLEDMVIGENLIITSENIERIEYSNPEVKQVEDDSFYHFNLKF
uniref:hypothetical protein n=2 Tax=Algoriphagus sp. TaxID=1872435 RepID=UPI0040485471